MFYSKLEFWKGLDYTRLFYKPIMALNIKKNIADEIAATGNVTIQASAIGFINFQFAFLFNNPIPKTAPIKICVEETGIPIFVASKMTALAPNSAEKPVIGEISASLVPTV